MTDETKLLFSKINDVNDAVKRGRMVAFTSFLCYDDRLIAESYCKNSGVSVTFYGGYDDAERCVLGVSETAIENYMFPIDVLKFTLRNINDISHRDVLGALMSLGLKREVIGDIIFSDGNCYILCLDKISEFILQNLISVKKYHIKLERHFDQLNVKREYEEINATVSSLRLDCVVAEIAPCSRTQATELILSGFVTLNGYVADKKDRLVNERDIISIRRKGKFRIGELLGKTKKDRIKLKIYKYI